MRILYLFPVLFCAVFLLNSCRKNIVETDPMPTGVAKTDSTLDAVKPDIQSLYFLRNTNNYPKNRVIYYEMKNTDDTYHMIRAAETSFRIKYSPTGEVEKFENLRLEGDYRFNESGLPIVTYDEGFLEREYFYNEKRLLVKVNEYHRLVKEFLRQYTYKYDENSKLTEFIDNVSSGELKSNTTIKIYPNRIISTYAGYGTIIKELNTQQLPVKFGKNDIVYSVENNVVTIKLLNEDNSVFTQYVISFDENNKPVVPVYPVIFPYQHYDDMIVGSLLNYSNRNVMKIAQFNRTNQGEMRQSALTTYTYKYNALKLPIEVYKVHETWLYSGNNTSQFSKQLIKIEYEE